MNSMPGSARNRSNTALSAGSAASSTTAVQAAIVISLSCHDSRADRLRSSSSTLFQPLIHPSRRYLPPTQGGLYTLRFSTATRCDVLGCQQCSVAELDNL